MKTYIALLTVLSLLIFFMFQPIVSFVNHARLRTFDAIVLHYAEASREDGYFTPELTSNMRAEILSKFSELNDADIYIDVCTTIKYRRNTFNQAEYIDYDVRVPIKKLYIMNDFLGISDADNQLIYPCTGRVPSENLLQ